MIISKTFPTLTLVVLSFIPILLWFLAPAVMPRWSDSTAVLSSIGQLSGLVGATLMALTIILSARLPWMDRYFNGLNQLYVKHNYLGQLSFILILFHPLLLIPKYAGTVYEAARFLWWGENWANNWGILSLGLMIVLLVLTLYLRPRYYWWKWSHKFFGLVFLLAVIHLMTVSSDISRFWPLKFYLLTLSLLGGAAFVYRSLMGKWLVKRYEHEVSAVKEVGGAITEIRLKPLGTKLKFKSGQFVFLNFRHSALGREVHPFSIVSAPPEEELVLAIKNLGDYTAKIGTVEIGTKAEVEGPFGTFTFQNIDNSDQIWIAGGIGITPFLSMAETLGGLTGYNVTLFYAVKNRQEATYLDWLTSRAARSNGQLKVISFFSEERGRLSSEIIRDLAGDFKSKAVLACAPVGMIKSLRGQLVKDGLPRTQFYSEEFSF